MNGKTAKLLRKSHQISPYSFRSIKAWWLEHPAKLRAKLRRGLKHDLRLFAKASRRDQMTTPTPFKEKGLPS